VNTIQPENNPSKNKKISLIIPTMNESKNIPYVFGKIPPIVDEIIVIDSSQDDTVEVIKAVTPHAKIIRTKPNGKGNALKIGFQNASGDIFVIIDADGSMNPDEIPRFIEPLFNDCDVVQGSRILGGSEDLTLFRRFGNFIFVTLVNTIFDCNYSDLCYGFRAFKKEVIAQIKILSDGFEVETELSIKTRKSGFRICEIPSFEGRRIHGTTNLKAYRDGLRILLRIFKEWET
jgi:glycosyltransferase involved in cell wall biosynthesis